MPQVRATKGLHVRVWQVMRLAIFGRLRVVRSLFLLTITLLAVSTVASANDAVPTPDPSTAEGADPISAPPATFTYADLTRKMVDLEGLASLPESGEKTALASSYDRARKYDPATNSYINWDANRWDCCGVVQKESDGSSVLAEINGPGVIWRIWSADPRQGHVKIYLDGAPLPAIDLPFRDYFNLQNPPFVYPGLVYVAAGGYNSYVPIPFQKSAKVVAGPGWGQFYQFTYTTYPSGTVLPSFQSSLSPEGRTALQSVNDLLLHGLGSDPGGHRSGETTETGAITVGPGQTATLANLGCSGAITSLKIKLDPQPQPDNWMTLRDLALQMKWDGETSPSVWVPLGDFFGTAPGVNYYKSLPMGMTPDGFYSYWYMPFGNGALVQVVNDGSSSHTIDFSITRAPLTQPPETLGRFHAKWHRDTFPPKAQGMAMDWTLLVTQGKGRYVGTALHVWNPDPKKWWGEGNEKFFVDGEKWPSDLGTGSEGYFGYAWGNTQLFRHGFHDQTLTQGRDTSVNRWQIADNVPFQNSFDGLIEKFFLGDNGNIPSTAIYDDTVYWYLAPGGTDPYGPVPLGDRIRYNALASASPTPLPTP